MAGAIEYRVVPFLLIASVLFVAPGAAQPLAMIDLTSPAASIFDHALRDPAAPNQAQPQETARYDLRRQEVSYSTREAPGTIIVDTANTYLYLVLGNGRAMRYGIGVGRSGFTWSGVSSVTRKAEWPDWVPPPEMIRRQRYLPRWMAGGPGNPLGARALYLGASQYRIHGTNDPATIGQRVSSGCFRLANEDVIDLYHRVRIGAKVVVLQGTARPPVRAAALPRQSKSSPPSSGTTTPPPDKRSTRSIAFGLY
jgi:lipoprotein-anchoring transpeptidase ErfK/SrfK